jgi:hypothetical protein
MTWNVVEMWCVTDVGAVSAFKIASCNYWCVPTARLWGWGDFFYKAVPATAGMTWNVVEMWCVAGLGAVGAFKIASCNYWCVPTARLWGFGHFFYKAVPAIAGMTWNVVEMWCVMGGGLSVRLKLLRVVIGAYLRHACRGFGHFFCKAVPAIAGMTCGSVFGSVKG